MVRIVVKVVVVVCVHVGHVVCSSGSSRGRVVVWF